MTPTKLLLPLALALSLAIGGCSDSTSSPSDGGPDKTVGEAGPKPDGPRDGQPPTPDGPGSETAPGDMTQPDTTPAGVPYLYVGETNARISVYQVTPSDGTLSKVGDFKRNGSMSFLAFHPQKTHVYATINNNVEGLALGSDGVPSSFVGEASIGAKGTHLEVEPSGRYVLAVSYDGDAVAMFPLSPAVGAPMTAVYSKSGSSYCANAHQVRVHPSGRFAYVPCLGSDHILVLGLDANQGKITEGTPVSTQSGAGPRHLDFHPTLDVAYVVNESDSTVNAYSVNTSSGALSEIQSISTLPSGTSNPSASSDIHVSPDGRHLYAINREPLDNIAIFSIDGQGKLAAVGHESTGGTHSRSFVISADGKHVFVGNSKSKDVVTFSRASDGKLTKLRTESGFASNVWFVGLLYR